MMVLIVAIRSAVVTVIVSGCCHITAVTTVGSATFAAMQADTGVMMFTSSVMMMHIVNCVHTVANVRRNIAGDDHTGTRQNNANLERDDLIKLDCFFFTA